MPFDGRDYSTRIDALEKIDRVIEQLPSEERWCKGALYTVDGRRCILGAMQAVNGADDPEAADPPGDPGSDRPALHRDRDVQRPPHDDLSTGYRRACIARAKTSSTATPGYAPGSASRISWLKRLVSVG